MKLFHQLGFWLSFATLCASRFTPEDLLSSPRLGSLVPNKNKESALYHETRYSFDTHSQTSSWNVLDLTSGKSEKIFDSKYPSGNVIWLGSDGEAVLQFNATNSGGTDVWVAPSWKKIDKRYHAGTIPGPVSYPKAVFVNSHGGTAIHVVFASRAYPNGTIYNSVKATRPHASGHVYESLYVRHWDRYVTEQKWALFATRLTPRSGADHTISYHLEGQPINLLGARLGLESPIPPFGGSGDFDISPKGDGVAFAAKNPEMNPANSTHSLIYHVPFDGPGTPIALNSCDQKFRFDPPCPLGASSSPRFSPTGKSIAFLQMQHNGYESDINHIFVWNGSSSSVVSAAPNWDVSPQQLDWGFSDEEVYVTADQNARHKLFRVELRTSNVTEIYGEHAVRRAEVLSKDTMLLEISSIKSSARPHVLDRRGGEVEPLLPVPEEERGLSSTQVEDFSFLGAYGIRVHGLITKPSFFDNSGRTKYRLAFFIHGGPQGSWSDSWSSRWNPAVFAEHGYVVVSVNPTGSTGYGQEFVDAIQGEWGGRPYIDLERAMEYLELTANYIDFNRAVALGASYGGYMINYIAGMPLANKFKALVCHDGVFSTLNQISSEELYFPQHDFKGTLWDNRSGYERWDPARNVHKWVVPHMIIHSELDYRLPVTEGLAAFNALQERGVPSKLLWFPDENHWVLKPENSLMWHREVFEWVDRWTSDEAITRVERPMRPGSDEL